MRRPPTALGLLLRRDLGRDRVFSTVIVLVSLLVTALLSTTVGGMLTSSRSQGRLYDEAQSPDVVIRFTGEPAIDDELERTARMEGVSGVDRTVSITVTARVAGEEASFNLTRAADLEPGIDIDGQSLAPRGNVILPVATAQALGLHEGDALTVDTGVGQHELTLAGTFDDPVFGSPMMGYKRAVVSEETYDAVLDTVRASQGDGALVTLVALRADSAVTTPAGLLADLDWVSDADFAYDRSFLMRSFAIIPGIVSAVLLMTTVVLGIVLVLVLRHISGVLIRREWRSSGVLKVLGLSSAQIRLRLGARLAVLSGAGCLVGAVASIWTIPALGGLYLSANGLSSVPAVVRWPGVVAAVGVMALVCATALAATRVLSSLSPRAALANQTGSEPARRAGPSLARLTRLPTGWALVFKDLVRSPGRYVSLFVTALAFSFLMGTLLPLGASFATRDRTIQTLGLDSYDVTALVLTRTEDPGAVFDAALDRAVEETGLPEPVYVAAHRSVNVRVEGRTVVGTVSTGFPDSLRVTRGRLPASADEVLLARGLARSIGVGVGDRVALGGDDATTYEVSGVYDTVNQAGMTVWLTEEAFQRLEPSAPSPYYYVTFDHELDSDQLSDLLERLNASTGISASGGRAQVASTVSTVQLALRGVIALVSALGALLAGVVATFLALSAAAVDRRTYAIMTVLGYARGQLRRQLALSFAVTAAAAAALGALTSNVLAEPLLTVLLGRVGLSTVDLGGDAVEMTIVCLGFGILCGAVAWFAAKTLPRAASSELVSE